VGIQAQGRTTILKVNYRNTAEVLAVAYAFAQEFFTSTEGSDEDAPVLIQPQTAGRRGMKPELIRLPRVCHQLAKMKRIRHQKHSIEPDDDSTLCATR